MAERQDKMDQRLWEYLDGALAGKDLDALQRDLQADPALRERLAKLSALRGAVAGLPKAAAPAHFAERVLAQAERRGVLDDSDQHQREPYWWVEKLLAAAAVVLLVALGGSIFYVLHRNSYIDQLALRQSPQGTPLGKNFSNEIALAKKTDKEARAAGAAGGSAKDALVNREPAASDSAGLEALAGGDEFEQPILIATSDLPETRRDVEHLLYANAFVSDHKIGMNNYVIEQAGAGQVIRIRGDAQQVLNVVTQLQGLQGASEQARMQQSQNGPAGNSRGVGAAPVAGNAMEPPAPRVIVQQIAASAMQSRLMRSQTPTAAATSNIAPAAPVPAAKPASYSSTPASAPTLMAGRAIRSPVRAADNSALARPMASSSPATAISPASRPAARQLVILIQPEE